MTRSFIVIFRFYIFWLVFSFLARLAFVLYNYEFSSQVEIADLAMAFFYGLKLDVSMGAYFLLVPILLSSTAFMFKPKHLVRAFNMYSFLIILFSSIIVIGDVELYRNWGFRMDNTPLLYLRTPGEAMASTPGWMIIAFSLVLVLVVLVCYWIYKKTIASLFTKSIKQANAGWLFQLLLIGVLVLPIRGGLGVAVLNASAVYFHSEPYLNHAAINVVWNVGYSLTTTEEENHYQFIDNEEANVVFKELHTTADSTALVLNTDRPNIVLIILESFTEKIIEPLGGEPGVCPNFNQLCNEGILFEHFYANGDRSDKGIVSILSGYPAQPTNSIIKWPNKTISLPFISKELEELDYKTAFYYGGDINFANMKSYFVTGGFDRLTTLEDFPEELATGKWGVHDEHVFNQLFEDINKTPEPFFSSFFTLSSHEPFEVPMPTVISGDDEDERFMNSAYYTDKCLGEFIAKAKQQAWWDNTLVVLLADHGSRLPFNTKQYEELKFKIPMLWLGGALAKTDTVVSTFGSQVDLARTLLSQMGHETDDFRFSKNIFGKPEKDFAFFVFNDGFGIRDKEFGFIHDNVGDTTIRYRGSVTPENKKKGQAFLQVLMQDFEGR